MRYDDWDVILFPRDLHVPIQEFKTACYNTQDAKGQQLATLTCYIGSLPPSTPFRISVHSWAPTARPSAIIEAQRKARQKVMYMVQVIVDGARVFRGCFEVVSRWPQEIAHEKQTLVPTEQPTSQQKPCLKFPPFLQHTPMHTAWESRDPNGRINIVLSEQLVCRNSNMGELDFGIANDIVCFSFQHAPQDILEQAGISWPIRNPLYLPSVHEKAYLSPGTAETSSRATKAGHPAHDAHMRSPLSHASVSGFIRLHTHEPRQRPNSHPPPLSHFPNPPLRARGNDRTDIWDDSFGSYRGNHDDVSLDSRSTKRSTSISNSTGDVFMGDCMFPTSQPPKPCTPWAKPPTKYQDNRQLGWDDQRSRKDRNREAVLTLRNDHLGQIIQAISPPKMHRDLPHGMSSHQHEYGGHPPSIHTYYPTKMGSSALTGRPSAAALARKSSYADLTDVWRTAPTKPSPDKQHAIENHRNKPTPTYHPSASSNKENFPPSQSRLPMPFPYANRVPTPDPFPLTLPHWDSDISMKDGSSVFSSFNRYNGGGAPIPPEARSQHGNAQPPSTAAGIKSSKEGLSQKSPCVPERRVRHNQNFLPRESDKHKPTAGDPVNTSHPAPNLPSKNATTIVEVIDVDALDSSLDSDVPLDTSKLSPFKPNHKPGMSSVDSTGRLERTLFSALGEELASFDTHMDTTDMRPELGQVLHGESAALNPTASDFEPVGKRKRQGTFGGERDRSPLSKKEKGDQVEDQDMPRLRGD